jgi:O-antigen/teichoic acid export membrane protein
LLSLGATTGTTLGVFACFFLQGIIVARYLQPAGRGELGTILYFPRDLLLYVGLLGAVEVVASFSAWRGQSTAIAAVRRWAAGLGITTGILTALVAAALSAIVLPLTGKAYLVPMALVLCLIVPLEHLQLVVGAVDRGRGSYGLYNLKRFLFAVATPLGLVLVWVVHVDSWLGADRLAVVAWTMVLARCVGLLPTLVHRRAARGSVADQPRDPTAAVARLPSPRQVVSSARPYGVSMLVSELFDRLDVLLMLILADLVTLGYYCVAVPAAALLIIAPNSLAVYTFNVGARRDLRVSVRQATGVLAATLAVQVVATLIMALALDWLIGAFFGSEFLGAVPLALWLLPASAIKGLSQAADGFLKGRGLAWIGVGSRAVGIVVMLGFVAAAFPRWHFVSIPMAACVGQTVSSVLILVAIYRHVFGPSNGRVVSTEDRHE